MPYKTYTTSQIVDFIGLIVDQAQIKDTAAKTGITLSTAYRYQKMWNETQEVPGEKKRGRVKSEVLTEEHTLFIVELVDSFAPMTLEQMRKKLIEEYPAFSISKIPVLSPCQRAMRFIEIRMKPLRKEKLLFNHGCLITKWILRRTVYLSMRLVSIYILVAQEIG